MTTVEYEIPIDAMSRISLRSGRSAATTGVFISGLMAMLDLQRPLPADATRACKILRLSRRSYEGALDELLQDGTFVRLPSGEITAPIIKQCRPVRPGKAERTSRSAIPSATRESVLAKTGGKCTYCAVLLTTDDANSPDAYQPDHVLPVVLGGSDDVGNLVPSCRSCNAKKRARTALRFLAGEGA